MDQDCDSPAATVVVEQLGVVARMVWEDEEHPMNPPGIQDLVPGRREGIATPLGCG